MADNANEKGKLSPVYKESASWESHQQFKTTPSTSIKDKNTSKPLEHSTLQKEVPKSKFVVENLAKSKPKLPLYCVKKTRKNNALKNVTMDDILKSVKALDDAGSAQKVERSASFLRNNGDLKKFQPCSSLEGNIHDGNSQNPNESCICYDFSTWELDADQSSTFLENDKNNASSSTAKNTPSADQYRATSESLEHPENQDKHHSENVVNFKSLLSSQLAQNLSQIAAPNSTSPRKLLDQTLNLDNFDEDNLIMLNKVRTEGSETPAAAQQGSLDMNTLDRERSQDQEVFATTDGRNSHVCAERFEGGYEGEANAASSVLDVSDFLTCAKGSYSKKMDSGEHAQNICLDEPEKFSFKEHLMGSVRGLADFLPENDHPPNISDSLEVQPSQNEEVTQKNVTDINPDLTTSFVGESGERKRTESVGQNVSHSSKNLQLDIGINQDKSRKILFNTASGKCMSISSENLLKAKNLFDACDDLSPKTCCASQVGVVPESSKLHVPGSSKPSFQEASQSSKFAESDSFLDPIKIQPLRASQFRKSLFSSASGKAMAISSANLHIAKNLFDAIDNNVSENFLNVSKDNDNACSSDSASSFEKPDAVETFDEILGKKELPLHVIEGSSEVNPSFNQSSSQTGEVDDDGSGRSCGTGSQLLKNLTKSPDTSADKADQRRKSFFNTASGKVLNISSSNLRKAKNLLDTCDDSTSGNSAKSSKLNAFEKSDGQTEDLPSQVNCYLDNDSDLFNKIETPIKGRHTSSTDQIAFSSSLSQNKVVFENAKEICSSTELPETLCADGVETKKKSVSPEARRSPVLFCSHIALDVRDQPRSPTVFNQSGVVTQTTYSILPTSPAGSNSSNEGPKSPVLLNGSFIYSTSPTRSGSKSGELSCESRNAVQKNTQGNELIRSPIMSPFVIGPLSSKRKSTSISDFGEPTSSPKSPSRADVSNRCVTSIVTSRHTVHNPKTSENDLKMSSPPLRQFDLPYVNSETCDETLSSKLISGEDGKFELHSDVLKLPQACQSANDHDINFLSFKSAAGKRVKPTVSNLNRVKAMLSDILVEDLDISDTSAPKPLSSFSRISNHFQEIVESPREKTASNASGREEVNDGVLSFKSAAGKAVIVSEKNLGIVKAMFGDVLDEETHTAGREDNFELSRDSNGEASAEFVGSCSPVLLDGSFVVNKDNLLKSKNVDDEDLSSKCNLSPMNDGTSCAENNDNVSEVESCSPVLLNGSFVESDEKGKFKKYEKTSVLSFKSGGGKSITATSHSLDRAKALFSDAFDGIPSSTRRTNDEMSCSKDIDVLREDKGFYSPIFHDEPSVDPNEKAKSAIDEDEELLEDACTRSPVLNCSVVIDQEICAVLPESEMALQKSNQQLDALADEAVKRGTICSPEWEDFPDLKSSQADHLEEFGNHTLKENVALNANKKVPSVVWGEFPEMLNVEFRKLEQGEFRNNGVQRSQQLPLRNLSVTSGNVQPLKPKNNDETSLGEMGKKRKSIPNSLEGASKRSRSSISPTKPTETPDMSSVRNRLRGQQIGTIRCKRSQRIQSSPGLLFKTKEKSSRWYLKDLDVHLKMIEGNQDEIGINPKALTVSSENAADYRFRYLDTLSRNAGKKFIDGDLIADSCLLVHADDNTAGLKEITTAFLTSPHVDPRLVPEGWIKNHYRWIVWKLACLERTFPQHFSRRGLTLENVLLQLKYRYDREIDMVQRSAFKKMLEGDVAPIKFISCIASIKKNNLDEGESLLELELTDGWYSIWTIVDTEMIDLIKRDVVGVGMKLIIHSAELMNCGQGCDPLAVPSNVKLKISTNSVRRVKWFAKMGFLPDNAPIPTLLCSVLPSGGLIGQVTAVVVRKYPVIYMCKDGDGKTVFRSERSQAIFTEQQEKSKSDKAEHLYDQVWKEVESKYRNSGKRLKNYSVKEICNISDPEVLYNIMDGADEEFIQSQLSADQLRMVLNYKDEIMSKMKNDVQNILQDKLSASEPSLKVTKLLKVRLMDFITKKHALLTIWRPSEDDLSVLRENRAFEFYNLIASGTRDKVLQLSSNKHTNYSPNDVLEPSDNCRRVVTPLHAVDSPGFAPSFGEIDVVGVVVLVKLPEQTRGVTVVYLSDLEGHYISITFWTSLSVFGCDDLMVENAIISCSNLQWRSVSNHRKIPSVFASEITTFSLDPKQTHLQRGVAELKLKMAEKDVAAMVSSAKTHVFQSTRFRDPLSSPAPASPLASSRYASSPLTPAQKKLKLVSPFVEEAPPLSPMPLTVTTRHVFQNFKSPLRTPTSIGKSVPP